MDLAYQEERTGFLRGTKKKLRVGGYGGTVTLVTSRNTIRIKRTKPKRQQATLQKNSPQARRAAVEWAEKAVEEATERSPRAVKVSEAAPGGAVHGGVTPREIWLCRFEGIMGPVPPEVFRWTRGNVVAHYEAMSPNERAQNATVDTVSGAILAARRLHESGVLPLDVGVGTIDPDGVFRWALAVIRKGGSPHTPKSYIGRFRTALEVHKVRFPDRWVNLHDPTRLVNIRTAHIEPPEIGERAARELIRAAWDAGEWRIIAALVIAHETGRRIGAIGAHRSGQHIDAPPLSAADISEAGDGRMMVTWRGKATKGGQRGDRSDETLAVTETVAAVLRWILAEHPNPLGTEHPLIWDEKDPTKSAGYSHQRHRLDDIWQEAFGERRPRGTAFHAFCRTAITTLTELVGVPEAARYTGRTKETAVKYLRAAGDSGRGAADALHQARSRIPIGPNASFGGGRRIG